VEVKNFPQQKWYKIAPCLFFSFKVDDRPKHKYKPDPDQQQDHDFPLRVFHASIASRFVKLAPASKPGRSPGPKAEQSSHSTCQMDE
jgi:hypothetical protein